MDNITSETLLKDVVRRYSAAGVVLSRYGLDSYEEADPSSESLARFAESRGILVEWLLEELKAAVEVSEHEPPRLSSWRRSTRDRGNT